MHIDKFDKYTFASWRLLAPDENITSPDIEAVVLTRERLREVPIGEHETRVARRLHDGLVDHHTGADSTVVGYVENRAYPRWKQCGHNVTQS